MKQHFHFYTQRKAEMASFPQPDEVLQTPASSEEDLESFPDSAPPTERVPSQRRRERFLFLSRIAVDLASRIGADLTVETSDDHYGRLTLRTDVILILDASPRRLLPLAQLLTESCIAVLGAEDGLLQMELIYDLCV